MKEVSITHKYVTCKMAINLKWNQADLQNFCTSEA